MRKILVVPRVSLILISAIANVILELCGAASSSSSSFSSSASCLFFHLFLSEFLFGRILGVLGRAVTAKVSTNSLNLFERFSEPAIFPERVMEGCCSIKWKNLLFRPLSLFLSLSLSLSTFH